jgi:hypothetical protein
MTPVQSQYMSSGCVAKLCTVRFEINVNTPVTNLDRVCPNGTDCRSRDGGTGPYFKAGTVEGANDLPAHHPAPQQGFSQMAASIVEGKNIGSVTHQQDIDILNRSRQLPHVPEILYRCHVDPIG